MTGSYFVSTLSGCQNSNDVRRMFFTLIFSDLSLDPLTFFSIITSYPFTFELSASSFELFPAFFSSQHPADHTFQPSGLPASKPSSPKAGNIDYMSCDISCTRSQYKRMWSTGVAGVTGLPRLTTNRFRLRRPAAICSAIASRSCVSLPS